MMMMMTTTMMTTSMMMMMKEKNTKNTIVCGFPAHKLKSTVIIEGKCVIRRQSYQQLIFVHSCNLKNKNQMNSPFMSRGLNVDVVLKDQRDLKPEEIFIFLNRMQMSHVNAQTPLFTGPF